MVWEAEFLRALAEIRTPFLDTVMGALSMLGYKGLVSIALGLILLIFARTRSTGFRILLSIALAYIFANLILKNIVARPRPYDAYSFLVPLTERPSDFSFPSGHSVNAFAAATAIFCVNRKWGVLALVIASLIAFSRLYNCVHYPTDVIAGAIIGIGFALLVHYVVYPACERMHQRIKEKRQTS